MIRVAIATLGCKTNTYESSAIADQFCATEHCLVPFEEDADIYIINTCTVTGRTDFKSRNLIRKALEKKRLHPEVKVVVTGCFAQRNPNEIKALGAIDLIVDNQNKQDIASFLTNNEKAFTDVMLAADFSYRPVRNMLDHTRAFQKIQDGCDYRCTYCAVPYGRGNSRSSRFSDVVVQAKLFMEHGYKEIVLGGVNLALYQDGEYGLADVVETLQTFEGLELIRLSSLEPHLVTPKLLTRISACPKLCPHFHLALQSGCDSVLNRMGRQGTVAEVADLIEDIHALIPNSAIGLDVICGFPGESDDEFRQTQNYLNDLDFSYLHVFPFSRRPGTPASIMTGQISRPEIKLRTNQLSTLSKNKKAAYISNLIDKNVPLRGVCESINAGLGTCVSDHYIRGYSSQAESVGSIIVLRSQRTYLDGVR